jgi:hypothetical protein
MAQTLQLRPYQNQAATFLYERDRAMILAPVGAGKTAITLTAMEEMLFDGIVNRWLVVAPKRVCTDVWPVEAPKWSGIVPALAVGTPAQRTAAIESSASVVVINYDNLDKLKDLSSFDGVVFDELTRLKNPSGKRYKALEKIMSTMRIRWGLTGSFTSNGLEDVFGQCKIIDQTLLGRAKGAFLQQYFICTNRDFGQWVPAAGALEQVMQRIRPATFVLEPGEYKDKLPPCHVTEVRVTLDDRKPYDEMKREYVTCAFVQRPDRSAERSVGDDQAATDGVRVCLQPRRSARGLYGSAPTSLTGWKNCWQRTSGPTPSSPTPIRKSWRN